MGLTAIKSKFKTEKLLWFIYFILILVLKQEMMADLPPPGQVTCPLCNKVCTISVKGSDSLPNNLQALHIIELKKALIEWANTITDRDNTITDDDSTITKQNNILKNGQ